jgi:hypothetical protein
MELLVDKRIQNALHPLTHDEYKTLEANCVAAGRVLDSIKVWGDTGIIVDGHNRYKIAQKHNLPFETEVLQFESTDDVMVWILDNQFGRRNLSSVQLSMARAQRAKLTPDTSKEKIAASLGVSDRQLRTDATVQKAVEEMPEELRERVETSGVIASQKDLAKLAALPEEVKQEVYQKLSEDKTLGLHEVIPKEEKSRHGLSRGDLAIVDEHFDSDVKRMIHVGTVKINNKEIAKLMGLVPVKRQLVFDMIASGQVQTFSEAFELAKTPKKNSNPAMDITRAAEKFDDMVGKAIAALDSYASAKGKINTPLHLELVDRMKLVIRDAGKL